MGGEKPTRNTFPQEECKKFHKTQQITRQITQHQHNDGHMGELYTLDIAGHIDRRYMIYMGKPPQAQRMA